MEKLVFAAIYFFIALFGVTVGSFLNVLIWRLPRNMNVTTGRSLCPHCQTQLRWYDLVPVLSFLLLRGRCRSCHAPISFRYPFVELLTGGLFALCFWRFGISGMTLLGFCAAALLLTIAAIDRDTMEIPDGLVIALTLPAIAAVFLAPEVSLFHRLLGFFAVSLPMLALALLIKGAFGGGDIKLMAVCGALLGFPNVLVAMFLALCTGGMTGIVLLARGGDRKKHIAFGPHLCFGVFVALLFGDEILKGYLAFLFP